MMTAHTMVTNRINGLASASEKLAQLERTIATELPQELSRLPEQYGFSDVNPLRKEVRSAAQGGTRRIAGCPKKAAAVPRTRRRALLTPTSFTDDSHPTILAAARSLIHPSQR